jgi:aryl-phospho-beta-D-glucosidase BglC (GH1 family)
VQRTSFFLLGAILWQALSPAQAMSNPDEIQHRAIIELGSFTGWLQANHAQGYIGEVGWPDNRRGDAKQWNSVAQAWFKAADDERLWVTVWATGEWWPNYSLGIYKKHGQHGVDFADSQAAVLESHAHISHCLRGVNVCGAEFGASADGSFSNHAPGKNDIAYHYDGQETFNFLASRGTGLVRIPFRWERLQPVLKSELDPAELHRLKQIVARAERAGLSVVLDVHNYGEYWLFDGTKGVRRTVGCGELPIEAFTDLWRRISEVFKDQPKVFYGLMNEPHDFPSAADITGAQMWERASQAALDAIRRNGDKKLVLIPGYHWSGVRSWKMTHPVGWITDPDHNFRYEAHHYWDSDASGTYRRSYADELAAIEKTRELAATRPSPSVPPAHPKNK